MYYIQKSESGSYYISPNGEKSLFNIDKIPEKPATKIGYTIALCVDEENKEIWYEYKIIKPNKPTIEERLSALESAMLAMMEG